MISLFATVASEDYRNIKQGNPHTGTSSKSTAVTHRLCENTRFRADLLGSSRHEALPNATTLQA